MSDNYPANDRGYTLVEMMAVMAIVALICALAAPKIGSGFRGVQLKTGVKQFAATLRAARSVAVSHRARVAVVAELGTGNYELRIRYVSGGAKSSVVQGNDGGQKLPEFLNGVRKLPENIIFTEFLVTRDMPFPVDHGLMMFYPRGNATGGSFVIGVEDGPQYTVNVDFVTGRVSIEAMS